VFTYFKRSQPREQRRTPSVLKASSKRMPIIADTGAAQGRSASPHSLITNTCRGLKKTERVTAITLAAGKQGDLNFSNASMFHPRGIEVFPNWMAIPEGKNGKPRQVPMNRIVREKLSAAAVGAKPDELIFTFKRNGVSWSTIRTGFERACENAKVVHGQTVNGGITWHDLRRTFATRFAIQ